MKPLILIQCCLTLRACAVASWLRLSTEELESDRKHCASVEQDQMQGLLVPMAGKVATDDWVRIGAALAAADFSQLMVQCYIDVSAYGARAGTCWRAIFDSSYF